MSYTVKEAPKPPRWQIICNSCHSSDVQQKAWCYWDEAKQNWVFDDGWAEFYCNNCEEYVNIDEVELK